MTSASFTDPPLLRTLAQRHHLHIGGRGDDAIVFLHGFGADQKVWRFVAPAFEATHRVVLFDHLGCGSSDMTAYGPRHDRLEAYAEDVVALVEALGLQRVMLVGHSVGGVIAMMASLARPALFSRLVLVSTSPRFLDDPPAYSGGFQPADLQALFDLMHSDHFGWARMLAPMVVGEQGPQALAREFEVALRTLDARSAGRFARLAFYGDHRALLPQVHTPALVLHCLRDRIVPRAVASYLHQRLPDSRLLELDADGHCPQLSHPALTIEAIRGHLAGPFSPAARR
ncbi:alpha/beta fold hydrolase [Aquincola sp. J276]|uniref:alpha/beta fold hydrolase n=1 Tax=Aquincola sp. J276 TaxID=2898432 RepID=UPI002150AD92|nr:alpha/beta hydrolase [Aquincola sp. J276]MCR5868322.1 alpha/beta hydrolase [Aquincola sp. J276]